MTPTHDATEIKWKKFLERYKLPRLTQEQIEIPKRPVKK